ncbi:MAG: single-stranded DNA-binding protein [Candidatus Gracilibacteria bacterium]
MAMSLNRVQLIGNVTKDPEVRQIPGGATVATFSIATNYSWKDASGQRQDKPEFHNLVAWRKLGEICAQYVRKGSKVFAEGRIQTREWEGQDGAKRYRTEIILDNMIMLDKKGASEGMDSSREHSAIKSTSSENSGSPVAAGAPDLEEEISIDDLPF